MRVIPQRQLAAVLGALPGTPRIVAGGNYASPWQALSEPSSTDSACHGEA